MTDQRAKWMNDSCTSVSVSFGTRLVTAKRTGRKAFPHHLIVLKTVIAIAWPWMLCDAVPVAAAQPTAASPSRERTFPLGAAGSNFVRRR